mmetsp:Transcript_181991/g.442781  ORF Transcript_181991/g.442781 Transcript_181991/m.442781 type:complete len:224 (+) Transcript_181991:220-891(+)
MLCSAARKAAVPEARGLNQQQLQGMPLTRMGRRRKMRRLLPSTTTRRLRMLARPRRLKRKHWIPMRSKSYPPLRLMRSRPIISGAAAVRRHQVQSAASARTASSLGQRGASAPIARAALRRRPLQKAPARPARTRTSLAARLVPGSAQATSIPAATHPPPTPVAARQQQMALARSWDAQAAVAASRRSSVSSGSARASRAIAPTATSARSATAEGVSTCTAEV